MILYYMLDGEPPWPELDGMRAVTLASYEDDRPPVPRHWDAKLSELLHAAWADDPKTRPSYAAVLEILEAVHKQHFKCTFEESMKRGGVSARGHAPAPALPKSSLRKMSGLAPVWTWMPAALLWWNSLCWTRAMACC